MGFGSLQALRQRGGPRGGGLKRFVDFVFRCSHNVFELAIARLGQCRQIPGHASDPNPRIASGRCALKIRAVRAQNPYKVLLKGFWGGVR